MSERDELAAIIAEGADAWLDSGARPGTTAEGLAADAVLAAGYRKPRTVTTAAELDALPVGSVVLTAETWAATKTVYGWHYGDERVWFVEDHFPATVLHEATR